jgi:hypothetical protein
MSLYEKYNPLNPKFWDSLEPSPSEIKFKQVEEDSRQKKLHKIFKFMTYDEKMDLACLSLNGSHIHQPNGDVMIMRGMHAFEKQQEFEDKMIEKYYKP